MDLDDGSATYQCPSCPVGRDFRGLAAGGPVQLGQRHRKCSQVLAGISSRRYENGNRNGNGKGSTIVLSRQDDDSLRMKKGPQLGPPVERRGPDHWGVEALCSCCIRLVRWPFSRSIPWSSSTCPLASSFLPMAGWFKAVSQRGAPKRSKPNQGGSPARAKPPVSNSQHSSLRRPGRYRYPPRVPTSSSNSLCLGLKLTGMPTLAGPITSSLHLRPHPSSPPSNAMSTLRTRRYSIQHIRSGEMAVTP